MNSDTVLTQIKYTDGASTSKTQNHNKKQRVSKSDLQEKKLKLLTLMLDNVETKKA